MKTTVKRDCFAQVNLSLDVLNRREDGYHNLEMIMQTVSLKDTITISVDDEATENCIYVKCDNSEVPQNGDNLAAKAAELFLEMADLTARVDISIEKHIPMGAGLGGGSSDAAGVLCGLNEAFGNVLKTEDLAHIAGRIGSDVPFFIYGGAMLAEGTGTVLSEVTAPKGLTVLIAKPMFPVSTPYVYKNLRLDENTKHPDTKAVIDALKDSDLEKLARHCGNVLETVTATEHKEIGEYKTIMTEHGAVYALMSGSGPSVFGVYESRERAEGAYNVLKRLTDEVYITETV